MKTQRYGYHLFALIAVVTIIVACGPSSRQRVAATLDDVETYINDRPDSALAVLRCVDTTALRTPALRARYSLLHVMALYKNYEDVTRPGLLDDAVRYYDHHGSADEKLKMRYYQGCILQEKKDLNGAAIAYSQAEQFADKAGDKHAVGLLYVAFGSVYNAVYNTQKELEYRNKAVTLFRKTSDPMLGPALGGLALVYHTKKDWSRADSLYRESIAQSDAYPQALSVYLSNYARMKLLQPEKDPVGTIELLDWKRAIPGQGLTTKEAGAYAYALALTGKKDVAGSVRSRLDALSGRSRYDALPWLARIAVLEGDMEAAYKYQVEMHADEEAVISETLTDSVTQSLQDYYNHSAQQERERKLRQGIWALCTIVLLLGVALLLLLRERRLREERDRLVAIRASLEQDLRVQENLTAALSSDMSSRLERLRIEMQQERLERLRKTGRYGYWLWMEQKSRSSDKEVIKSLRKDLQEICAVEKDFHALERRMDRELDGLVSRLKEDLDIRGKTEDERFLCFWLIGLKPDMVAELMDITPNYVYVKTHRLEKRIRQLGKAEYLSLAKK